MSDEDPFEFVGSDSQGDAPAIVRKTPPPIRKTPPSIKKTRNVKMKSPRIVIGKNSDEVNELLDIKKAIEESKRTALQEERARRYKNRALHKVTEESKEVTKKKGPLRLQKETSPCGSENNNDLPANIESHQNSSAKQASTPVDVVPSSSSKESTPILKQTPTKKDSPISSSNTLCSGSHLNLKRKRLPSTGKEPSIKLFRVETDSVKKPKPVQQSLTKEKCDETEENDAINSSYKSTGTNSNIPVTEDGSKEIVQKLSQTKGKKAIKKITKEKRKTSSPDTPQYHLKKCPSLYAPHGTNAHDYLPVIVRFFEDFKLHLRMAQNECVTFIPWSPPVTSSKKDWQTSTDDNSRSITYKTTLELSLPHHNSPAVRQQQRMKSCKETVNVDSLWGWDSCAFDNDDQRLFYDSDQNVDRKSSQEAISLDSTLQYNEIATPPIKHVEKSPPSNRDISIDISSSNSNTSSIIHHRRRKRKLLGRKLIGNSDITPTGSKQSNSGSTHSLTSSLPRGPIRHHAQSSSPNISGANEEQLEEPANSESVCIDLTELEETQEMDSHASPKSSQEKQATCPVCQQLFSEAYISIHAADCELHVDSDSSTSRIPTKASLLSSSKLRQTTLTHKPLSTNAQRKRVIESDSDPEELIPPSRKRKVRKLLSDKSKISSIHHSKEDDTVGLEDFDVQLKKRYSAGSAAANSIFKSTSLVDQAVDDIDSYSSEDDPTVTMATRTIIDYKNQFSTNSVGKVSNELLMEDNEAFLLSRKKKWMSAKKGRTTGKEAHQRKWKRFKAKGKGKKAYKTDN